MSKLLLYLFSVVFAAGLLGIDIAVRYPPLLSKPWHIAVEITVLVIGIGGVVVTYYDNAGARKG